MMRKLLVLPIAPGCSSSSNWCALTVPGGSIDRTVTTAVTLIQGGASETLTSEAWIGAYCYGQPC